MNATGARAYPIPAKIWSSGTVETPVRRQVTPDERIDQRGLMVFHSQATQMTSSDISYQYQPQGLRDKANTGSVAVAKLEWYDNVYGYFVGPTSNTRSSAAGARCRIL